VMHVSETAVHHVHKIYGCFSLAISTKASLRANVYFLIWLSSGVPSARKVINTFIYSKHDALWSTKQGSCIMHH